MGFPSVYPTGTTVYDPKKSWNGFTVFQAFETGAVLIDMADAEPFEADSQSCIVTEDNGPEES